MDVEAWLNDLGLGQYAEAFGTNDIDGVMFRMNQNIKPSMG